MDIVTLREIGSCQRAGKVWIETANALAIQVASVIIPEEFNVLVNPRHPDYDTLTWTEPRLFSFDPRLFTAEPQIL